MIRSPLREADRIRNGRASRICIVCFLHRMVVCCLPMIWVLTVFMHFRSAKRKVRDCWIVRHLQARRIDIRSTVNEPTDVDGQRGAEFPLHIECLPGALRVQCPPAAGE